MKKKTLKSISGLLIGGLILLFAVACGGGDFSSGRSTSDNQSPEIKNDSLMDNDFEEMSMQESENSPSFSLSYAPQETNQKIIRRVSLDIETRDFDGATQGLLDLCRQLGGYVESSTVSGGQNGSLKKADLTFRVPRESLDSFLAQTKSGYTVVKEQLNAEDVSAQYHDTEARLKTLRIQQDRLNELLKEAAGLEDIIRLNESLSDVEYQIESLTGNLLRMDDLVSYSTVSIHVSALAETEIGIAEDSFGDRLRNAWDNSLIAVKQGGENFVIILIYLLPALVFLAVVGVTTLLIVRHVVKKNKRKREEAWRAQQARQSEAKPSYTAAPTAPTAPTVAQTQPDPSPTPTKQDEN